MAWLLLAANKAKPNIVGTNVGIFAGGYYTSPLSYTDLYSYSNDTVTPGSDLKSTCYRGAGAGNYAMSYFTDNANTGTASIYNYYTGTTVFGAVLSYLAADVTAIGNNDVAIFAGGRNGTTTYYLTKKYTYTTNTVVSGGNLMYTITSAAGLSVSDKGILISGNTTTSSSSTTTNSLIYTFASDSARYGASLTQPRSDAASANNNTIGIVTGGTYNSTSGYQNTAIYTFASNTFGTGSNIVGSNISSLNAGTGNTTIGFISNRSSGLTSYTYATNTVVKKTGSLRSTYGNSATSTSPGGF